MKHFEYVPTGVCSRLISFDLDEEGKIHNLGFLSGCNGNLKAISKLCEGKSAKEIADLLYGNTCGMKNTSCADQLAKAIITALNQAQ